MNKRNLSIICPMIFLMVVIACGSNPVAPEDSLVVQRACNSCHAWDSRKEIIPNRNER